MITKNDFLEVYNPFDKYELQRAVDITNELGESEDYLNDALNHYENLCGKRFDILEALLIFIVHDLEELYGLDTCIEVINNKYTPITDLDKSCLIELNNTVDCKKLNYLVTNYCN